MQVADDGEGGFRKAPEVRSSPGLFSSVDPRGPFFAIVVVSCFLFASTVSGPAKRPGATLPWTFDPTGYLGPTSWLALWALTLPAKEALNASLLFMGNYVLRLKRIDQPGEDTKVRKLERLEAIDLGYLALNTVCEFLGMNHIVAILFFGPVEHRLRNFCFFNGPVAFIFVMMLNDFFYYPFHVIAHRRSFYPYVHKQHHRQYIPFRGYADAANQHPFEQMSGFCIFMLCLRIAAGTTGLHAGTAWVAFLIWAILNMCNHLAFDSRIHLPLPYPAYPHDHQMHHRFPQCNYSTLTMAYDRMFGSFRPYIPLDAPPAEPEKKLMWYEKLKDPAAEEEPEPLWTTDGRPELVPSPWSFIGLFVALVVATVSIEICNTGDIPDHHEWGHFIKTAIVMVNAALVCFAIEKASCEEVKVKGKKERTYTKRRMAEAVPAGLTKQFAGGREVFKPDLNQTMPAKPVKRILRSQDEQD